MLIMSTGLFSSDKFACMLNALTSCKKSGFNIVTTTGNRKTSNFIGFREEAQHRQSDVIHAEVRLVMRLLTTALISS